LAAHIRRSVYDLSNKIRSRTGKILITIFVLALIFRVIVASFRIAYGANPIPWLPYVETWSDFSSVYGQQLAYLKHGLLPYSGFAYTYTPLFLYILFPFYNFGGISAAAVPILLADSASAVLVYLLVLRVSTSKVALLASVAYALSPFVLVYEGYLLLSSQPMFFFVMLALYLLRQNKPLQSSVFLGIAFLFKQEAIFILPVYATWYIGRYKAEAWKGILAFLSTLLMVSVPFLLLSPLLYFDSISYDVLYNYFPVSVNYPHVNETAQTIQSLSGFKPGTCSLMNTNVHATISSCPFGMITYSTSPTGPFLWPSYALNILILWGQFIEIPLFVLVAGLFYKFRKKADLLELGCAFATVFLLVIFSLLVHGLYRYYYVPVYGLLLASSKKLSTVSVVTLISIVSLLLPGGSYQTSFALIAIVASLGLYPT